MPEAHQKSHNRMAQPQHTKRTNPFTYSPTPTYPHSPTAPKEPYTRIANTARETDARILRESTELPPRSGTAFAVKASEVFRISTPEGGQVGDLNMCM